MSEYEQIDLESSIMMDDRRPMTLIERILSVKQLIFSKTRLEFRLVWNKIFQTQDEELGWLLNPYRRNQQDINLMTSIRNNGQTTYHYNYSDIPKDNLTIYTRKVRKIENKDRKEKRSSKEKAIQIARYMGMGAYMTSTAFPSPFMPSNDYYMRQDQYYIERIW